MSDGPAMLPLIRLEASAAATVAVPVPVRMAGLAPEARVPRSSDPATPALAFVVAGVLGRFAE